MGCTPSSRAPSGPSAGPTSATMAVKAKPVRRRDPSLKPEDFVATGLDGATFVRRPGQIAGEAFTISNCKNSTLLLFDHSEQVTIDKCDGCHIVVSACAASVFVRDCTNCDLVVACQQFRSRDCKNIRSMLYSQTRPIIEASASMRFSCFRLDYFGLAAQFGEAGLNPWNNRWSEIHDFSSRGGASGNWNYLDGNAEFNGSVMPEFPPELCEELSIVDEARKWRQVGGGCENSPLVPYSIGVSRSSAGDVQFVLVVGNRSDVAAAIVHTLTCAALSACSDTLDKVHKRPLLLRSKAISLNVDMAKQVLASCEPMSKQSSQAFIATVTASKSLSIGLEFGGISCSSALRGVLSSMSQKPLWNIQHSVVVIPPEESEKLARQWFDSWSEDIGHKL